MKHRKIVSPRAEEEELEFTIESLEADCGPNASVSLDRPCLFLNILKFAALNGISTYSLFFLLSPLLFNTESGLLLSNAGGK